MAKEIVFTATMTHQTQVAAPATKSTAKTISSASGQTVDQAAATNRVAAGILNVATTDTVIDISALGGGTVGVSMFKNLDGTNIINLKDAAAGHIFASLKPGETCGPIRLGSGAQVPNAIALSSTCNLEYVICEG